MIYIKVFLIFPPGAIVKMICIIGVNVLITCKVTEIVYRLNVIMHGLDVNIP